MARRSTPLGEILVVAGAMSLDAVVQVLEAQARPPRFCNDCGRPFTPDGASTGLTRCPACRAGAAGAGRPAAARRVPACDRGAASAIMHRWRSFRRSGRKDCGLLACAARQDRAA